MNDLLVDAISNLDNDIIEQYFKTKETFTEKKNKARFTLTWKKQIMVAACFVIIAISMFVIVKFNINNRGGTNLPMTPNIDNNTTNEKWNGLSVSRELYEALSNAKDTDYLDIIVSISFSIPNDYVYNGKKYNEYLNELNEDKEFLLKAEYLLSEGDLLKYGELIYIDGTPDGTRWTKTKYDKIVAYYGESMLNTYVVNGEFLKNKLLSDIESTENGIKSLENSLNEVKEEIRQRTLDEGLRIFDEVSKNAIIKDNKLHFTITKEVFSNLTIDNKEKYSFSLASENE